MIIAAADPDFAAVAVGLLGGLSLFLFGMGQLTDSLREVAGGRMRVLLGKLTTNRYTAAITGAFVTAVIQSSSVTTVLVVGFISAGLMSLAQSVGVIMGANVGTTITAQIIAFKVTEYALVLVTVGFAGLFFSKRDQARQIGGMIMGLGLIFFGMNLMSEAAHPLRDYEPFVDAMRSIDNPIMGIALGAAFTAIVQSSSATTGIVIVMATQGFITLEAGIALALGANIGTCFTAVLAAVGKQRAAMQAA
ncbi:MAG: Na/Pi symporter, partial [Planctomycetota bacterium]